MRKLICYLLIAVLTAVSFSACSAEKEQTAASSAAVVSSSVSSADDDVVAEDNGKTETTSTGDEKDQKDSSIAQSSNKSSGKNSSKSENKKSSNKSSSKKSSSQMGNSQSRFEKISFVGTDTACEHSFGSWKKISKATCQKQGREERVCTKCKGKEIGILALADHNVEIIPGTPATCNTTGTTDGEKCKTCGTILKKSVFAPIDPKKHEFEEIYSEPTLILSGYKKYICTVCGYNKDEENQGPIDPTLLGIPVIYFEGNYTAATKSKKETLTFSIKGQGLNLSGYATIKWQGNTAVKFDKKNYSVKFYEDEELTDKYKFDPFGWGKEYEYCLKANWVDASHARNIVTARLWGQMCGTRKNLDPNLKELPNYGAIDGYPVLVYMNGAYHGIYTMNIPKDKWMFDMKDDDTKKQAILMGAQWGKSSRLMEEIPEDLGIEWEVEHCSTEDTAWAIDSFNNLIRFINDSDDETFKKDISKYVDVEAAIDQIILAFSSCGYDNYGKNVLYATYDGVKWIPSVYDMDATWGLWWDGTKYLSATEGLPSVAKKSINFYKNENMLWKRLLLTHKDQIVKRYEELRKGVLSNKNITTSFSSFMDGFPLLAKMAEVETWPETPMINTDYKDQIMKYIPKRMAYVDSFFDEYKNTYRG